LANLVHNTKHLEEVGGGGEGGAVLLIYRRGGLYHKEEEPFMRRRDFICDQKHMKHVQTNAAEASPKRCRGGGGGGAWAEFERHTCILIQGFAKSLSK